MCRWVITAWIVASLGLHAAKAAEDNLYFSGILSNEPCTLAIEDKLIELDFKSVIVKDLYLNSRTRGKPIALHLKNCDMDVGKRMVYITFRGNESAVMPGLLVVDSTNIKGLLVGLETTNGSALPVNRSHRMAQLSSGDNVVNFNAYLQGEYDALANKTLGLGAFEVSIIFSLEYE